MKIGLTWSIRFPNSSEQSLFWFNRMPRHFYFSTLSFVWLFKTRFTLAGCSFDMSKNFYGFKLCPCTSLVLSTISKRNCYSSAEVAIKWCLQHIWCWLWLFHLIWVLCFNSLVHFYDFFWVLTLNIIGESIHYCLIPRFNWIFMHCWF